MRKETADYIGRTDNVGKTAATRNAEFSLLIHADVGAISQLSEEAESEARGNWQRQQQQQWLAARGWLGRLGAIIGCQPTVNQWPSAASSAARSVRAPAICPPSD